jgi:hypothetical protein
VFCDGPEQTDADLVLFIVSRMWFHEPAFLASEATSRIATYFRGNDLRNTDSIV